ncbi:hypothetical protein UA08_05132 [Talaromyces atroroseus]|uniref:Uncharacterized protein n=1 Tax=Talaromyces atroroseus TaxID=1441469 RepID=A0A225AG63_TALAT|nr:hypothetical protein UA08_05132 [Talaromyces atroroseus]OKL59650.1 hypothetical protein UA08_05132 [Talaromyces atroroseus]
MAEPTYIERLTPLDLLMPKTYIRVLFVFEQAGSILQIIQNLGSGLDRLLKQVPWLSGRVFSTKSVQDRDASLEIRRNANHAPTIVDKGTVAASYKCAASDGVFTKAIPSSVWPGPSIDDVLGVPVFAASIFRFADQGAGLCVCLHHNAVDGIGFSEIMRLWAQNVVDNSFTFSDSSQTRSERLSEALSYDLTRVSSIASEDLLALHPEYSKMPPALPDKMPSSCTAKLFTISIRWVDILKTLMRKYTLIPPTTNVVICALIWPTVTRVRMQDNPSLRIEMSRLAMAVNGRPRISETFSRPGSPYFGNAVFYSLSKMPATVLAESDETPVRELAKICDEIARSQSRSTITSRHIAEVYQLASCTEDRVGSLFVGWDLFGSRDLTITNWADLELYGIDFGNVLGKPKFVRLPHMEADGVALILPRQRSISPEILEVMIMLRRDHLDALESDPMWQMLTSR